MTNAAQDLTDKLATEIMAMVIEDIAEGLVPATVTSFQELHSYTDANMYLEAAGQPWTWESDEEFIALIDETNAITDEVSRRLAERA